MPESLQIALQNRTDSAHVFAYITGIAIQNNGARVLLKANGQDLYYPSNPPGIGTPLAEDCAIPLGPPGNTVSVNIPQIAGGRLWFSQDSKLTFLLNPGPALVEPSVLNPTDPNANVNFGFCEFTLNNDQLFANISYVDFASAIPIALTLESKSGSTQHVAGTPSNGLDLICDGLRAQAQRDGQPWDKLIVTKDGKPLRALNPTHGNAVGASFDGYFEPYIDAVWEKYEATSVQINTQAAPGVLPGTVHPWNQQLIIGGQPFSKPTTADVLGCNSGPFTTGPDATRNAIIPRLAAAFCRSALLETEQHPSPPETFWKGERTNHYARIVHEVNRDGKGYAFAYDDVQPDEGEDQSGKVNDGNPRLWTVTVGGR
ncbi:glycoside hydrolase family 64 protein [Viridothelium virens]|uniref:Glycoside hydrolase family 64 protein n=1 Tax=Viridothelium virens TaxID=1048519 RepID=A0A6A6GY12_VIRVR|nr:glycoside hydrolase family 64 protein [Viridothelium virens]